MLLLLWVFSSLAGRMFGAGKTQSSAYYFSTEKKLSAAAVLFFIIYIYAFDLKFYLKPLSLNGKLPILENVVGLAAFFILLSIIWLRARPFYQKLFHHQYSSLEFVVLNIKLNLPIVLPWLILSFVFDVLALVPIKGMREWLLSPWGDLLLFVIFVCLLTVLFPPLVKYLWNCRPIPPGPDLERINSFCREQKFHTEILYWPLFEGQAVTAGIMGIIPRFRYLLVTPALLEALGDEELDSVLAHEIGHVRKKHLVLYVLLFLGFSILSGALAAPLPHLILASDVYYKLLQWTNFSAETLLGILSAIPLLALLLVYFRFVFGFFIRNFERQADTFVFYAQNSGKPLIRSFEKIALLTGTKKAEKNWHHFGIGERIGFLEQGEADRTVIKQHDRKVAFSLVLYFVMIALLTFLVQKVDLENMSAKYEVKYAEAVLQQKARQDPGNSLWPILLGDFMQNKKMEVEALEAYESALKLNPSSAKVNNNLAWLLLTAQEEKILDPRRALSLARTATLIKEAGFIYDTLAVAYWANGFVEEAVAAEVRAIQLDPGNKHFYIQQIEKFTTLKWGESEKVGSQ